jgi:signal transduction histidine kinase
VGPVIVGVVVLLGSFALPAFVAVRSTSRISAIREDAMRTEALATIQGRLQERIIDNAGASLLANALIVDAMRATLAELAATGLASGGPEESRLEELQALVERRSVLAPEVILEGVVLMQDLRERESARQAALLSDLRADAEREVRLAAWGFVTITLLATWFLWARLLNPLRGLASLLNQVGEGRYEVASTAGLHPMVLPVFEHYNGLVQRLEELEDAHLQRAETLEKSVRTASSALIEQQYALARSERLAAVGETAAGLAHELRNPLAGVVVTLDNLKRDVHDAELAERLETAESEVGRAVQTLNDYLRSARHAPERAQEVELGSLIRDLTQLLSYQAPAGVSLHAEVAGDIVAALPRERLRQAVMNLVLNAFQAMTGRTGAVRVSVARGDATIDVRVEDDGPGFPPEVLDVGIRPFATSRERGTGLGLAIVRRAAEDMGGRLELYNREAGGAGVCLRIPIHHA